MIIVFTCRGYEYTHRSLRFRRFGVATPDFRTIHYERLFRARSVPRATCLFTDLDRLEPWELRAAADFHRQLTAHGLRCLNNPARAKSRVELLNTLFEQGRNPVEILRADTDTAPSSFPVFLRFEQGHLGPLSGLLHTQSELTRALRQLVEQGTSLRGMIIVGFAAEPIAEGLWVKWGTFRVGDAYSLDHIAVDSKWQVTRGDWDELTDEIVEIEYRAVEANALSPEMRAFFETAEIEYGRADHGTVAGRAVLYEINSNPFIGHFVPDSYPLRRQSQMIGRRRLAAAFEAIDTEQSGRVRLKGSTHWRRSRAMQIGLLPPKRP
jgi:hypothetical protein